MTRGTTGPNRLRRMDRWITATHGAALRRAAAPLAVDLGFGAAPWTAVELLARLRRVHPAARVVGVEIDPARVAAARPHEREGLTFRRGGFDFRLDGEEAGRDGERPTLIRAANVLRQYPPERVPAAWALLCGRLAPGGLLVDGTCDEIGRRHAWVTLGPDGPRTLTLAAHLATLDTPGELAERLPKALIHRNVPGEPVHRFLRDLDRAWAGAAPYAPLGARQRWTHAARAVSADWPLADGPRRWREGEITVRWSAVAPARAAARGDRDA